MEYKPQTNIKKSNKIIVSNPDTIYKQMSDIKDKEQEMFIAFYLRSDNSIITRLVLNIGSSNASVIDIKALVRNAILLNANSVIVSHNHPSGNVEPSEDDLLVTTQIKKGLSYFGISLLDHIIVGDGYRSII
jgi:DNA repair protein RadC